MDEGGLLADFELEVAAKYLGDPGPGRFVMRVCCRPSALLSSALSGGDVRHALSRVF